MYNSQIFQTIFGSYGRNGFCMEFDPDSQIIDEDQEISEEHSSTLFHEYWHFNLNTSTIDGLKSLLLYHSALHVFSNLLMHTKDGSSVGSLTPEALKEEQLKIFDSVSQLRVNQEGGKRIQNVEALHGIKEVGEPVSDSIEWFEGEAPIHRVPLTLSTTLNSYPDETPYQLTSYEIDEGIAAAVDRYVGNKFGYPVKLDPIPYDILPNLIAFYTGQPVNEIKFLTIAKIGTLAMLTVHPAYALIDILVQYSDFNKEGLSDEEALDRIWVDTLRPQYVEFAASCIAGIESIKVINQGRGPAEEAWQYLGYRIKRNLKRRYCLPFYDIDALAKLEEGVKPLDILQVLGPALAIQKNTGYKDFKRDNYGAVGVSSPDEGKLIANTLPMLQAQREYLSWHWNSIGKRLEASESFSHECPFYYCCDHCYRETSEDICKTQPWKHYQPGNTSMCWFSTAIASTISKYRFIVDDHE